MVNMNKKGLILSFVLSFMLLTNVALAQYEWFSDLGELFGAGGGGAPPDALIGFLNYFGVPEDILVGWGGIFYYIIIPLATFALVLKAILVEEIMVNTMKLETFRDWRGWLFILLILGFLLPTGLVGMTAMWLYASAGILVIYGFGALLLMAVIQKLTYMRGGRDYYTLVIGVIVAALVAAFIPNVGIVLAGLAIFMSIVGYRRTRRIAVMGPLGDKKQKELDYADNIMGNIKRHLKGKKELKTYRNKEPFLRDAQNLASDLINERISLTNARKEFKALKTRIDDADAAAKQKKP